jgi:hypothetical protein
LWRHRARYLLTDLQYFFFPRNKCKPLISIYKTLPPC